MGPGGLADSGEQRRVYQVRKYICEIENVGMWVFERCTDMVVECRITHDYPVAAAKAFKRLGTPFDPFRFVYISGEGTHQDESGSRLFSKIKGRTEKELQEMENESFKVISIRPGGIVPTEEVGVFFNLMKPQNTHSSSIAAFRDGQE